MDQNLTFEAVNAHVEQHFTSEQQNAVASNNAASVSVCAAYATVRPVLMLLANFQFIPQKWKDAVMMLMGALDTMCPQQQ